MPGRRKLICYAAPAFPIAKENFMTETYTTKSGDMWDSVAYTQLGSTSYTDKLIEANLEYRELFLFPAGVVLKLPEIETAVNSSLPPWKSNG
jgi:phage tail protein X